MGDDPGRPIAGRAAEQPIHNRTIVERGGNGGMIFAIVALALVLAIGFFFMTAERRDDARTEAVTGAAQSVDEAARAVGDAAKDAANKLRNNN
jgi:hypothetical protein